MYGGAGVESVAEAKAGSSGAEGKILATTFPGIRVIDVDRSEIVESPESQPREAESVKVGLEDLVLSIKALGLLDPIKVFRDSADSKYRVLDGHRRLAAIDELVKTDPTFDTAVRVMVMAGAANSECLPGSQADAEWLVTALVLNAQRKDLTLAERGLSRDRRN
ncbi:MAG: ParB/RepB/Spo0J family partition protein [Candidatus Dormibacteria bacterium]